MMCPAISPVSGPPRSCRIPSLSSAQLNAFRTCMSSNGGISKLKEMYRSASDG